jgi:hypothetical protein
VAARWAQQLAHGSVRREVLDALAGRPDDWPPNLPGILLEQLERRHDRDVVMALAGALAVMPTDALVKLGPAIVLALRRRASASPDADVRAALRRAADRVAQRAGLEPEPEVEFGEAGLGLTALGEPSAGSGPCDAFHARLDAILRIHCADEMPVRFGTAREEVGPAVEAGNLPWLVTPR